MALQLSVRVRNARLDVIESTIGTTPYLDLRTGAQPADCAAADAGTELAHMALPSDWMAAAGTGSKAKAGTWSGTGAAGGTAGHFRVKPVADDQCDIQGSVTATGGGGQLELDNVVIAASQAITISTFTLTEGNG